MPYANLFRISSKYGFGANCSGTYFGGDEAPVKCISKWGRGRVSIEQENEQRHTSNLEKKNIPPKASRGKRDCWLDTYSEILELWKQWMLFQCGSFKKKKSIYCFSVMYRHKSARITRYHQINCNEVTAWMSSPRKTVHRRPLLSVTSHLSPGVTTTWLRTAYVSLANI